MTFEKNEIQPETAELRNKSLHWMLNSPRTLKHNTTYAIPLKVPLITGI